MGDLLLYLMYIPTPTTDIADVILLPSAMWIEREGMFGNSERRTQHFEQMLDASRRMP